MTCGVRGRLEVDHIKPVRDAPELAFVLANLQSLCPSCHGAKTRLEVGFAPPDPKRIAWRSAVEALLQAPTHRVSAYEGSKDKCDARKREDNSAPVGNPSGAGGAHRQGNANGR
ncbi:MAG: HNH endonuclease signature motif containing protein [Amphiplicatus sp.]